MTPENTLDVLTTGQCYSLTNHNRRALSKGACSPESTSVSAKIEKRTPEVSASAAPQAVPQAAPAVSCGAEIGCTVRAIASLLRFVLILVVVCADESSATDEGEKRRSKMKRKHKIGKDGNRPPCSVGSLMVNCMTCHASNGFHIHAQHNPNPSKKRRRQL